MYAIEIEQVYKSYGDFPVLEDLNLRVMQGRVYGLLGPNGAGKTTLIHLMLGFLKANRGTINVLGTRNLERVRGRIGYVPERLRYHMRYSAREYLRFLGQFSDMDAALLRQRVEEELERAGLVNVANRMLEKYSKGMLQRLGIAQALLADPELLVIDEPTSGLDPSGQRDVLDLLAELRSSGHTIFLCSHQLGEIEELCDDVGVLANGRLIAEANVHQLRSSDVSVSIQVDRLSPETRIRLARISPNIKYGDHTILLHPNNQSLQHEVLRALTDAHVTILSLNPLERPLERLYLQAVQDEAPAFFPSPPVDETSESLLSPGFDVRDPLLKDLLNRYLNARPNGNDEAKGADQTDGSDEKR